MDIDSRVKSEQKRKSDRGFTLLQVLITVCLIAIVSTFGVMAIASARASLRLSGSTRELAGYLEKARSNAIRRNDTATVTIVDANSYTVIMDSDGDGTRETLTIRLREGVTFNNNVIGISAEFDWRGRVPNQLGIILNDDHGHHSDIRVSGAGDVTLDSEVFQDTSIGDIALIDLPAAVASPPPGGTPSATPYPSATPTPTPTPNPPATPTPLPGATPIPDPNPNATPGSTPVPTPYPTPYPSATPTPTPTPTPVPCSINAPSTLSWDKNSSPQTFSITVANGSATLITATGADDIEKVSPAATRVTGSGTIIYTVAYGHGKGHGTITISSPCGNKEIAVTIQ